MKPLKLTMTGFESYCEKTEIDFTKLNSNGIFLISGETGAGKTTIFDAITFALYGSPSGDNRSDSMLRSHFADENTPTEVEFTFESNSKIYTVKRNPEYERKSKRGNSTTTEPAGATLFFITDSSRTPVTKLSCVTKEIEEILKLSHDQFCRIAMIAQGAFQKLLLAKTDEKKTIFRNLFNTQKYEQLQTALQAEDSKSRIEVEKNKNSLQLYISGIEFENPDSETENNAALLQIKNTGVLDEDNISELRRFLEKDETALTELKSEIETVDSKLEKLNSKIKTAEEKIEKQNLLLQTEKELESKKLEKEELQKKLKSAREAEKEKPKLQTEKSLLENSLGEYSEIEKLQSELTQNEVEYSKIKNKIEKETAELENQKNEFSNFKSEFENLKSAKERKIEFESEKKNLIATNENIQDAKTNLEFLISAQKSYTKKIEEFRKAETEYQNMNALFIEKRKLFNCEQAGILAESLQDGTPCPVCGSPVHPNPAVKSENAPSQKEVDECEKQMLQAQKISSQKSKEAAEQKIKIETVSKQIDENIKRNLKIENTNAEETLKIVNSAILENERQIELLEKNIASETQKIKRRDFLEQEIPQLEIQIENSANLINDEKQKLASDFTKNEFQKKTIAERKSKLKYETLSDAELQLKNLARRISEIENAVLQIQNAISTCETGIASLLGTHSLLKEQIASIEPYDLEELQKTQAELRGKKNELNERRDTLSGRKEKNKSSIQQIEALFPQLKKSESMYAMIHSLYTVVSGNISGQVKISLETYVQMIFFDRIIQRANLRLNIMTNGKYELRRRQDLSDKRSSLGLELNVKDFYTGRERFVESLSGGEQFQASLALALGLADEIQNSAGGIKLDTMFIDEGFGTLDSDTLNKAMKALEDLSKGNKLIGIISHVNELEERIQNKIRVSKTSRGKSFITIET